ncbi:MAG: TolC family protein [Crocinitomicaceae bacterium]
MKTYKVVLTIALILAFGTAKTQESTTFSLTEAEDYAINHNEAVKNALLDIEVARKKVWETTAIGLPQVNAEGQYQHLLDIPVSVVDAQLFNPMAEPGEVLEFRMGQEFTSNLSINASQLIFDGSYIVGLQFSRFFQKMSTTAANNTKQDVKAMVREAYYNVLIAQENVEIMDSIAATTESLYNKTKVFAENGMIAQEEADQVLIAFNRISVSKVSAERQLKVAKNLLKLQMGYSFDQLLELTESLSDVLEAMKVKSPLLQGSDIKTNANYVLMDQQRQLDEYSLKNEKAAYLPSVGAFFTHSQNAFRNEFNFFQDLPWYPTTIWGISMQIPVASSGQKIVRVQQAEIKLEQDQNNLTQLEKSLKFQELQLMTSFQTAQEKVELEKTNVDLAQRIYNRSVKRNETGVVSALEMTQLQNQLLEAEGNYIMAVMEMFKLKVELDKLYNR